MKQTVTSNEEMCELLKTIRTDKGITQTSLSNKLQAHTGKKFNPTSVRRFEMPETSFSVRTLFQVLNVLGVNLTLEWDAKK